MSFPILSAVTFIPLVGVALLLLVDRENKNLIRTITLGTGIIDLVVSLPLYFSFKDGTADMQFVERYTWIKDWGVEYHMGIDGISLFMVLLTTFTCVICYISTWKAIDKHVREFNISMLVLQTAMIGVFCSLDFVLFYVYWELMLIPMYLLIGVWGGVNRIYATIKFFIYTMAGSVLLLLAILLLYVHQHTVTGVWSFAIMDFHSLPIPPMLQYGLFLCFFIAFAIKVPLFPFHTWLPDAHVEAPTAGSVILAGILLKMGTYGFLRFSLPIFPEASASATWWVCWLALAGIVYGALVAMVQDDIKKLVAYSSVSHLGFVVLGSFALNVRGIEGGLLQMINHGISTGALFLLVGILYERRHTRLISEYGGITRVMPKFAAVFMIVTLSSIALPGTNGFVGEFLVLLGVFEFNKIYAFIATSGVIWAAVYMLWMFQRVMFGEVTNEKNKNLPDLSAREMTYMVPIIAFIFLLGVYPNPVLKKMEPTVKHLINTVNKGRAASKSDAVPAYADNNLDAGAATSAPSVGATPSPPNPSGAMRHLPLERGGYWDTDSTSGHSLLLTRRGQRGATPATGAPGARDGFPPDKMHVDNPVGLLHGSLAESRINRGS